MLQWCRYVQLILYQNPKGLSLWFIEKPGTLPLIGVSRPSNFSFNISLTVKFQKPITELLFFLNLFLTYISRLYQSIVIDSSLTRNFDIEATMLDYQIHPRVYLKISGKMFRQPYLNLTHCLNSGTMWSKTHDHELDYHIWCATSTETVSKILDSS